MVRPNPEVAAAGRTTPGGAPGNGLRWRHLLLILPAAVLALLAFAVMREPAVGQPIAFNHRLHTEELQLGCEFCHPYTETSAHAGLPDGEACVACHAEPEGTSPEVARLSELLAAGTPIRFNKLFVLASHVKYTHRRHVALGGLECSNCHGEIANTVRPPTRPLVRIDMDFCLDCHRAQGQTVDCVLCHR